MPTVEDLEQRLSKAEENIGKLFENFHNTNYAVGKIGEKIEYLKEKMEDFSKKLDKILEKPSKRWDLIINSIITGLITGGGGLIIGLFLK